MKRRVYSRWEELEDVKFVAKGYVSIQDTVEVQLVEQPLLVEALVKCLSSGRF
jgi:hypothetical protein